MAELQIKYEIEKKEKEAEIYRLENIELFNLNQKYQEASNMAKIVQYSLIPKAIEQLDIKNLIVSSYYQPFDDIGGDLYDVFKIKESVYGLLMADVSGHGIPAALISTMAKASFYSNSMIYNSVTDIMKNVNRDMLHYISQLNYFITAFFGILNTETGELNYTNAGHMPGFLYINCLNKIETLESLTSFLGVFNNDIIKFPSKKINLYKGDSLFLYTDGLVDNQNHKGERYTLKKLHKLLIDNISLEPEKFMSALISSISIFRENTKPIDDSAILYIKYNPK